MAEKKHRDVEGLMWDEGTICNVKWGGVRMRDLLLRAGVREGCNAEDLHLCFASHVAECEESDWFGGSISLKKAMDLEGDVLLAYEVRRHYDSQSKTTAQQREV